jgi:glucokinase
VSPKPRQGTLLADVGGTNVRFALSIDGGDPDRTEQFAVADFAEFELAAAAYLSQAGLSPRDGVFAVAGTVHDGLVHLTNHPWKISAEGSADALGLKSVRLVNDFTAIALAVRHLAPNDLEKIGGGSGVDDSNIAVLGPGTGLGVSYLFRAADQWVPVSGEGGHVGIAPTDPFQDKFVGILRDEFGRASLERALSGPGLVNLYLGGAGPQPSLGPAPSPADVAGAALGGDPEALAAVKSFSSMLGAAAGDMALSVSARGGVYVAGGVVPGLGDAFDRDEFRTAFEDKGRFAYLLKSIPTYLITHRTPGLVGLAHMPT